MWKYLLFALVVVFVVILLNQRFGARSGAGAGCGCSAEHFESSSPTDVGGGASQFYGWDFQLNPEAQPAHRIPRPRQCSKCQADVENICLIQMNSGGGGYNCRDSDITRNKDIDKYVLKSSVPACPDMTKFATKTMLQPDHDMTKYILKTELPQYCRAYQPTMEASCGSTSTTYVTSMPIQQHPDYVNHISKAQCQEYKKSWFQNIEDWLSNLFHRKNSNSNSNLPYQPSSGFPTGYGYSPFAGYGTDNPGYGLAGNDIGSGLPLPDTTHA